MFEDNSGIGGLIWNAVRLLITLGQDKTKELFDMGVNFINWFWDGGDIAIDTLPDEPKPLSKSPTKPVIPDVKLPKNKRDTPKIQPQPKPIYKNPLPSPVGNPFPTPPERTLPKYIDLNQRSHSYTSTVKDTLSSRAYGCLLYSPIVTTPFNACVYDYSDFFSDLQDSQEKDLRSLIAWLIHEGNHLVEDLRKNPVIASFLDGLGITDDLTSFLINKTCNLAFVGLTLLLKGKTGGIVGNEIFMYGCESILKFALHYAERSHSTLANYPIVTNTYLDFNIELCKPNITINKGNELPSIFTDCSDIEWEPNTVLLPDSAAFMNKGIYLVLFWVLESDPRYKAYYTTTQLISPIPEIWDVLDENGNAISGKCDGVWERYFKDLHRTQGYQFSRYYCNEYKEPIVQGNFKDKEDAEQYCESILALTTLTPRRKAPLIHSKATKDEYLKDLSHEGEKLIIRKVNVINKVEYKDVGDVLISYKRGTVVVP